MSTNRKRKRAESEEREDSRADSWEDTVRAHIQRALCPFLPIAALVDLSCEYDAIVRTNLLVKEAETSRFALTLHLTRPSAQSDDVIAQALLEPFIKKHEEAYPCLIIGKTRFADRLIVLIRGLQSEQDNIPRLGEHGLIAVERVPQNEEYRETLFELCRTALDEMCVTVTINELSRDDFARLWINTVTGHGYQLYTEWIWTNGLLDQREKSSLVDEDIGALWEERKRNGCSLSERDDAGQLCDCNVCCNEIHHYCRSQQDRRPCTDECGCDCSKCENDGEKNGPHCHCKDWLNCFEDWPNKS